MGRSHKLLIVTIISFALIACHAWAESHEEFLRIIGTHLSLNGEWEHYGMKGAEDIASASAGTPIEVYSIIWEEYVDEEISPEHLTPLSAYLEPGTVPYGRWIIPVVMENSPGFLIFADGNYGEPFMVAYGGARFAKRLSEYNEERACNAVEVADDEYIVDVKLVASRKLAMHFWLVETNRGEYVVPLFDIAGKFETGRAEDSVKLCRMILQYPTLGVIRNEAVEPLTPELSSDLHSWGKDMRASNSVELEDPELQVHSQWCWAASFGNAFRTIKGEGTCDEPTQCIQACWHTGFVTYRGISSQNKCYPVNPEQRCNGSDGPERCCSYSTSSPCYTCNIPEGYFSSDTRCCNRGYYIDQMLTLIHAFGWEGTRASYPVPWSTMKSEIDAGRPFETDGSGHAVCVYGYVDPSTVMYFDPWVGMGYMTSSYSSFTSWGYGSWGGTYNLHCDNGKAVDAIYVPLNGNQFSPGDTAQFKVTYECFVTGDYILYIDAAPHMDRILLGPKQVHLNAGQIVTRQLSRIVPNAPGDWEVSAVVEDLSHDEIDRDTCNYYVE
jgi:hypothetical protein